MTEKRRKGNNAGRDAGVEFIWNLVFKGIYGCGLMFGEKCGMSILESGKQLYKETKRIINDAKNSGQLVLFVGAGASIDSGMPLWKEAIEKIAEKMSLTDNQNDPMKIPQYYFNTRGKKEYTPRTRGNAIKPVVRSFVR